jgi:hypothetical protein
VVAFMASCANAEPAKAIRAPQNKSFFIDFLPGETSARWFSLSGLHLGRNGSSTASGA